VSTLAPPRYARLRRTARWLTAAYVVALGFIALWPTPVDRGARGSIASTLAWLHTHGVPTWVDYDVIEFTANIALFVPVGLLTVVLFGSTRLWAGVLAGLMLSCAIELSQRLFLPGRFSSLLDVLANTAGAYAGALFAVVLLTVLRGRTSPARAPQT